MQRGGESPAESSSLSYEDGSNTCHLGGPRSGKCVQALAGMPQTFRSLSAALVNHLHEARHPFDHSGVGVQRSFSAVHNNSSTRWLGSFPSVVA